MKYLIIIYIIHARKFVSCFINKILHFDTIITSRDDNDHVVLKRQLRFSSDDLKTMIDEINLLLTNEYQKYLLAFEETKVRYFLYLRKTIFQQIMTYVAHSAIKMILSQYQKMIDQFTTLFVCTNSFIIFIELSCFYKIQKKTYNERSLLLEDVHFH